MGVEVDVERHFEKRNLTERKWKAPVSKNGRLSVKRLAVARKALFCAKVESRRVAMAFHLNVQNSFSFRPGFTNSQKKFATVTSPFRNRVRIRLISSCSRNWSLSE